MFHSKLPLTNVFQEKRGCSLGCFSFLATCRKGRQGELIWDRIDGRDEMELI